MAKSQKVFVICGTKYVARAYPMEDAKLGTLFHFNLYTL